MPRGTKLEGRGESLQPGRHRYLATASLALAFTFCLTFAPQRSLAATSASINGISFVFDGDHQSGTFVDGMPWVVERSRGSGVRILRITPNYENGRHGYELNPKTKELARGEMGCPSDRCDLIQLDSRLGNSGLYRFVAPDTTHPLPRTYPVGSSILKVISYTGPGDCFNKRDGAPARTCVDHAAVLTVLPSPPPADSFRPPYAGTLKPIFSARDIDIDRDLPRLPNVANQISIAQAEAIFGDGDVLVNHVHGWIAERAFPRFSTLVVGGSLPETYGCQVGIQHNSAMLRSMQSGSASEKRRLVNRLVQRGIDAYFITKNGKSWNNEGGCVTPGWKPLVLYSGHLLQSQSGGSDLLNQYAGGSDEDKNTHDGSGGEGLWGVSTKTCVDRPAQCKNGYEMFPSCDRLRDGGPCKFGTACGTCSGSPGPQQPTLSQQRSTGKFSMTYYQQMSHVRVGSAAIARILEAEDEWRHPPFFRYIDRIASKPWNYYCSTHCSAYLVNMHKAYGCNSAECATRRDAGWGGSGPPDPGPGPAPTSAPAAPILFD